MKLMTVYLHNYSDKIFYVGLHSTIHIPGIILTWIINM